MAKWTIKFEKEDIITSSIGLNIMIRGANLDLVFSVEAMEELINDYKTLKLLKPEKNEE